MSPAYRKGASRHFPRTEITFDKFHVIKLLNDAVDQVRRDEHKERPELKKTRDVWLRNRPTLTKKQKPELDALTPKQVRLRTARALDSGWHSRSPGPCPMASFATTGTIGITGDPPSAGAHGPGDQDPQEARGGFVSLVPLPNHQRDARGHERPDPSSQGPNARLRKSRNLIAISYLIGGERQFRLPI